MSCVVCQTFNPDVSRTTLSFLCRNGRQGGRVSSRLTASQPSSVQDYATDCRRSPGFREKVAPRRADKRPVVRARYHGKDRLGPKRPNCIIRPVLSGRRSLSPGRAAQDLWRAFDWKNANKSVLQRTVPDFPTRHRPHVQGGPAKVRPTYIFAGNI